MKNIHILPTDKPSKLYKGDNGLFVFGMIQTSVQSRNDFFTNQNIYITNDEEIKEGDYYELNGSVFCARPRDEGNFKNKIILTTDQDLIKDGVQAIDNDFLEWFVKNPSCEKVEVIEDKKLSPKNIYDAVEGNLVYSNHGCGGIINSLSNDVRVGIDNYVENAITSKTGWETLDINNYKIYDKCYKIIIPKEEPKQKTTLEDELKLLVKEWQERQEQYVDIAYKNVDNAHANRKFTYKAMATRDCWKELLKLIEDEK